jgi:ABC-2 type transport system permease protein
VEVLLGLLRPTEILTGKTLGITIVAVGQFAAAIAGGAIGVALTGADILPGVAIDVIIASIPLYVAGVVLYSLIYAAIGATVTRQSEAQSATSPIAILLLLPYMLAIIYLPENPDGALATVLSIFPLTSPLVMPTRVATGSPSVVELALCYLLLPPAIALVAWAGGRIYSGAVLAGRRVSLGTVMRSLMPGGSASDTAG